MTDNLFRKIVLPVASVDDAKSTAKSTITQLHNGGGDVLAVHIIEKAGGAPDKASVEQRENRADYRDSDCNRCPSYQYKDEYNERANQ